MSHTAHNGLTEPEIHSIDEVTSQIDRIVKRYDTSSWRKDGRVVAQSEYLSKWASTAKAFVHSTFASIACPLPSSDEQFYVAKYEFDSLFNFFRDLRLKLLVRKGLPTKNLPYLGDIRALSDDERTAVETLYCPTTVVMRLFGISHFILRPPYESNNKVAMFQYIHNLESSEMKDWLFELTRAVESRMPRLTPKSKHGLRQEVETLSTFLRDTAPTCHEFKRIIDENVDYTANEWHRIRYPQADALPEPRCYLPALGQLLQPSDLEGRTTIFGRQSSKSLEHRRNPHLTTRKYLVYNDVLSV